MLCRSFGSGSHFVVNATACEIETRQCLDCWFLPVIKVFFLSIPKSMAKNTDCSFLCIILMRIETVHLVDCATLLGRLKSTRSHWFVALGIFFVSLKPPKTKSCESRFALGGNGATVGPRSQRSVTASFYSIALFYPVSSL